MGRDFFIFGTNSELLNDNHLFNSNNYGFIFNNKNNGDFTDLIRLKVQPFDPKTENRFNSWYSIRNILFFISSEIIYKTRLITL